MVRPAASLKEVPGLSPLSKHSLLAQAHVTFKYSLKMRISEVNLGGWGLYYSRECRCVGAGMPSNHRIID